MAKKETNTQLFDNLNKETSHQETDDKASPGILEARMTAVSKAVKMKRQNKNIQMVSTDQCRLWEHHNRIWDELNEVRCEDLISGFRAQGQQEFPCVVRKVEAGQGVDFEIVCGARRFWTAMYLGWDLLVDIRAMSDEEAFRLSDIENRDREDISDWERAQDYLNALTHFYENNQKKMAQRLEMSEDALSRLLHLAKLDPAIVGAYASLMDIKVGHGRTLKQLMSNAEYKRKVIKRAKEIAATKPLSGREVISELKKSVVVVSRRTSPPHEGM